MTVPCTIRKLLPRSAAALRAVNAFSRFDRQQEDCVAETSGKADRAAHRNRLLPIVTTRWHPVFVADGDCVRRRSIY